jgi:hypothetical protein
VIASTEALCRPAVLNVSDEVCQAVLQYVAALLKSEDYRPFFLLTQKRQVSRRLLTHMHMHTLQCD